MPQILSSEDWSSPWSSQLWGPPSPCWFCLCACMVSPSVVSDSLQPHGLYVAHQAPLSMMFPRQEYWSGLPFSPLGDLPDPGIEPMSLCLLHCQGDSLLLGHLFTPQIYLVCEILAWSQSQNHAERPLERGYYPHTSISSRTFLSASWRQPFSPDALTWKKDERGANKRCIFYPPPLPLLQAPSQREALSNHGCVCSGISPVHMPPGGFLFPAWCCILVFPASLYLFIYYAHHTLFIYLLVRFIYSF